IRDRVLRDPREPRRRDRRADRVLGKEADVPSGLLWAAFRRLRLTRIGDARSMARGGPWAQPQSVRSPRSLLYRSSLRIFVEPAVASLRPDRSSALVIPVPTSASVAGSSASLS